ncbi:hypothetical protein LTR17_002747 [Elasticomyces elasticus]|nr:hypothetical protein LTR17_002747 [Elasticomyces elasticus]
MRPQLPHTRITELSFSARKYFYTRGLLLRSATSKQRWSTDSTTLLVANAGHQQQHRHASTNATRQRRSNDGFGHAARQIRRADHGGATSSQSPESTAPHLSSISDSTERFEPFGSKKTPASRVRHGKAQFLRTLDDESSTDYSPDARSQSNGSKDAIRMAEMLDNTPASSHLPPRQGDLEAAMNLRDPTNVDFQRGLPLFPVSEHEARRDAQDRRDQATRERQEQSPHLYAGIDIGAGPKFYFSHLLLRDMCACPQCVDTSTKQKLFSTVDVPADIQAIVQPVEEDASTEPAMLRARNDVAGSVKMTWKNDIPGYGPDHETNIDINTLRRLARYYIHNGTSTVLPTPIRWSDPPTRMAVPYEAYMSDDNALYRVLLMLRTHGLLFLTEVPESEDSVSKIVERIGPLKNTFYGTTWDVRSVPQAKNVAYTAQDLGFHMDLMYMQQPPHLQFLHCIRSSSAGGASLFTDSFRAADELWKTDRKAFAELCKQPIGFHYNHPDNYYHQSRKVIELSPTGLGSLEKAVQEPDLELYDGRWVRHVSWAPPFQAPLSENGPNATAAKLNHLNNNVKRWYAAAQKFNTLIQKPEGIHERVMKPGECVVFDNRRILHARRAFEVGDEGKERWLRGAYMDEDPYRSKLQVLHRKFGVTPWSGEAFDGFYRDPLRGLATGEIEKSERH